MVQDAVPSFAVTPRARFMEFVRRTQEDNPELDAGEIADLVVETLNEQDPDLLDDYLRDEARAFVAWKVNGEVRRERTQILQTIDLTNKDAPPVAELSERRRLTLYERVEAWREFVPLQNRTRPLLDMTRRELLESADFDRSKVFYHGFKSLLKQRLAEGLPDDTTPVGEVYTAEQVINLTERIKNEMNRGNFRLRVTPAARQLPERK